MALIARMTRSSMLDVLGQDYIRTARAKGLRKNSCAQACLPQRPASTRDRYWPGTGWSAGRRGAHRDGLQSFGYGRTLYDAITARDYGIVQAFTVVIAFFFVILNLIVDLSYAYLDPRVQLK